MLDQGWCSPATSSCGIDAVAAVDFIRLPRCREDMHLRTVRTAEIWGGNERQIFLTSRYKLYYISQCLQATLLQA
jgi:hypothetical protein